jgi:hypothetical protein
MNQQAGNAPPGVQAGGGPGMGTAVTGATADKVEKAALASYPGTIERIEQLPDGSYVAHVIQSNGGGEIHVLVDENFAVQGKESRPSGPPPGGMMPPGAGSGQQPPATGGETETN